MLDLDPSQVFEDHMKDFLDNTANCPHFGKKTPFLDESLQDIAFKTSKVPIATFSQLALKGTLEQV